MTKLKPYVSLDIETTGADINTASVLQVAAVYDDGVSAIDQLETFDILIDVSKLEPLPGYKFAPYALALNKWIFDELVKGTKSRYKILTLKRAHVEFGSWLTKIYQKNNERRLVAAGKNVASFDMIILKNNGFSMDLFKYGAIDAGSLYVPEFGTNVSLSKINKSLGREEVSHNALDDCFDVVHAIRNKFGGNNG